MIAFPTVSLDQKRISQRMDDAAVEDELLVRGKPAGMQAWMKHVKIGLAPITMTVGTSAPKDSCPLGF